MLRSLVIALLISAVVPMIGASAQSDPTRAKVMFLFDENVPADQEVLIREGIRLAQDFFIATFGADVKESLIVEVTNDPTNMRIQTGDHLIEINVQGYAGFPPLMQLSVVVHEYFHIWQGDMVGFEEKNRLPTWFIEGGADYIGLQSLIDAGLISTEEAQERTVLMANGVYSNAPPTRFIALEELNTHQGFINPEVSCCAYVLSTVAVQHLIGEKGPKALVEFFQALADTGKPWQSVFSETFEMQITNFYADFEAQREQLLSSTGIDVTQLFQLPDYSQTATNIELSTAPEAIQPDEQALFFGWADNAGAACTMTIVGSQGSELANSPAYADAYGLVVWFWTPSSRLDGEEVSATFDCGATPVIIDIPII